MAGSGSRRLSVAEQSDGMSDKQYCRCPPVIYERAAADLI